MRQRYLAVEQNIQYLQLMLQNNFLSADYVQENEGKTLPDLHSIKGFYWLKRRWFTTSSINVINDTTSSFNVILRTYKLASIILT